MTTGKTRAERATPIPLLWGMALCLALCDPGALAQPAAPYSRRVGIEQPAGQNTHGLNVAAGRRPAVLEPAPNQTTGRPAGGRYTRSRFLTWRAAATLPVASSPRGS